MQHVLFISDLHLCESRPAISTAFIQFLQHDATKASALYILGDLFEYWAGDDTTDAHTKKIIGALKDLSLSGVPIFLQHGNRDFLIGKQFLAATGITLLDDPVCITIFGERVLLSHGDVLCTDDSAYQVFRQEVRNPAWQATFLSQPIAARMQTVEAIRTQSEQAKTTKSMMIMDVNQVAVENLLREFDYPPLFIHGHTHRPQQHLHYTDGHATKRVVLGDWYDQGSCLKLQADLSLFNTPILL